MPGYKRPKTYARKRVYKPKPLVRSLTGYQFTPPHREPNTVGSRWYSTICRFQVGVSSTSLTAISLDRIAVEVKQNLGLLATEAPAVLALRLKKVWVYNPATTAVPDPQLRMVVAGNTQANGSNVNVGTVLGRGDLSTPARVGYVWGATDAAIALSTTANGTGNRGAVFINSGSTVATNATVYVSVDFNTKLAAV